MPPTARRRQPPITIRSARAVLLLRQLTANGRSQADIIEEALEHMASQRRTLAEALLPMIPQPIDWQPIPAEMTSRPPDFSD